MEAGGRPVGGSSAGQEEREQFGVFCTGNQCFARGWYKSRVKEGSSWKHGRISAVTAVDRLSSRRLLALQLKAGSRFPPAAPVRTRRGADGCSGVMLGPLGPPRGRRRQAEPQQKGRPRRPSPAPAPLQLPGGKGSSYSLSTARRRGRSPAARRRALKPYSRRPGRGRAPREGTAGEPPAAPSPACPALTCTAAASPKKAAMKRLQSRHSRRAARPPAMAAAGTGTASAGAGRGHGGGAGPVGRGRRGRGIAAERSPRGRRGGQCGVFPVTGFFSERIEKCLLSKSSQNTELRGAGCNTRIPVMTGKPGFSCLSPAVITEHEPVCT